MVEKKEHNFQVKVKNLHTGRNHFVDVNAYSDKQARFLSTMGVKGLKAIEITKLKPTNK
jgi:hypothetical protein